MTLIVVTNAHVDPQLSQHQAGLHHAIFATITARFQCTLLKKYKVEVDRGKR